MFLILLKVSCNGCCLIVLGEVFGFYCGFLDKIVFVEFDLLLVKVDVEFWIWCGGIRECDSTFEYIVV
jgi:hypothetical protein